MKLVEEPVYNRREQDGHNGDERHTAEDSVSRGEEFTGGGSAGDAQGARAGWIGEVARPVSGGVGDRVGRERFDQAGTQAGHGCARIIEDQTKWRGLTRWKRNGQETNWDRGERAGGDAEKALRLGNRDLREDGLHIGCGVFHRAADR